MATHQSVLTPTQTFFPLSEFVITWQTDSAAHKLKPRSFHESAHLWVHSADFHPSVNCAWQYYQTSKSAVASEQFCLLNPLSQFRLHFNLTNLHFKVQMASSCHNSSTLVPSLGTSFNMISCFSDQTAYPPNTPWYSRQIHQRGRLSLRSPSSTIQPGRTVLPVPGPSIVPANNNPNWEDAPTTNSITNLTANRPTSSTHSQSKPWRSDNTNEQLAEVLSWLANTLNANQTLWPNTNSRGTKACIPNTFSSTEPDKLNNFLFQCWLYFYANPVQFNMDIAKINFAMTYLTGVA